MLLTAGAHDPEILFVLEPGKLNASPLQIAGIGLNVGEIFALLTVMLMFSSAVIVHIELVTRALMFTIPFEILGI